MMLPTHALVGMVLGLGAAVAVPEVAGAAVAAGLLGGILPDLDLYAGHRKTLHYPVYYTALAAAALVPAVLAPGGLTVGAAVFLLGAAAHSVADIFGAGLELRPWEATSDRAVYDHYRHRWIEPRCWVRYDGSPGDLLLSLALAVPLLVALEGTLRDVVLAVLGIGVAYAVVRRVLPDIVEAVVDGVLVAVLPGRLLAYVPDRYLRASR